MRKNSIKYSRMNGEVQREISRIIAKSLNLRNTPELTFVMDDSIEYGINMSKRIDELNHSSGQEEEE